MISKINVCVFTVVKGLSGKIAVDEDVLSNRHHQDDEIEGKLFKLAFCYHNRSRASWNDCEP